MFNADIAAPRSMMQSWTVTFSRTVMACFRAFVRREWNVIYESISSLSSRSLQEGASLIQTELNRNRRENAKHVFWIVFMWEWDQGESVSFYATLISWVSTIYFNCATCFGHTTIFRYTYFPRTFLATDPLSVVNRVSPRKICMPEDGRVTETDPLSIE
jgi:hypothetical protein